MTSLSPLNFVLVIVAVAVCLASAALTTATTNEKNLQPPPLSTVASPFLTRKGSTLFLHGKEFKFGATNCYWLGLDENVCGVDFPTHYRIRDALNTAKGMGLRVVRAHTLGISVGNSKSFEPALNVFNASNLHVAADYAIWYALQIGIKLVIPLIDNWRYYEGGRHTICSWFGISEVACETEFYTNETVIQAFETYIKARLTHVNKYTGRAACDELSIGFWETGNELLPPPKWTQRIARFIKSIDRNHLVMSGTNGVSTAELNFPEVDIYSSHFYGGSDWPSIARLDNDVCHLAKKVYFIGEFGWTYNKTGKKASELLDAAFTLRSQALAGVAFWSLFPHNDGGNGNGGYPVMCKNTEPFGFVQHGDGFTAHFPGDWPFMKNFVKLMMRFSFKMLTGNAQDGDLPCQDREKRGTFFFNATTAPIVFFSPPSSHSIAWRGVAGSSYYDIYKGTNSHPLDRWKQVAQVSDDQLPWTDPADPDQKEKREPAEGNQVGYFVVPAAVQVLCQNVTFSGRRSNVLWEVK